MEDEYDIVFDPEVDPDVADFLQLAHEVEANDNASDEAKRMARNVLRDGEVMH